MAQRADTSHEALVHLAWRLCTLRGACMSCDVEYAATHIANSVNFDVASLPFVGKITAREL